RELLAHATHRLGGRAARDAALVGEHDVPRAERGQVERDRGAGGACAGYDDSSHASSSRFSFAFSVRRGARTSSRTGTPRLPRTYLAAAWKGNRSSPARSSPTPSSATTRSGKTEA